MNKKGLDFKHKEVISINTGKKLGFIQDVTADFSTGTIKEIIVPGSSNFFTFLYTNNQIIIPWEKIKVIGDEVILVDI